MCSLVRDWKLSKLPLPNWCIVISLRTSCPCPVCRTETTITTMTTSVRPSSHWCSYYYYYHQYFLWRTLSFGNIHFDFHALVNCWLRVFCFWSLHRTCQPRHRLVVLSSHCCCRCCCWKLFLWSCHRCQRNSMHLLWHINASGSCYCCSTDAKQAKLITVHNKSELS